MAWLPIARTPIQYEKTDGNPASGYYLKFYLAGTTTPTAMATDATGATQLAKCKLNERGFPISNASDETSIFIPHVNSAFSAFKYVIYQSSTDADANNFANAIVNISSVGNVVDVPSYLSTYVATVDTYADISSALNSMSTGQQFILSGHTVSGIGGGIFDVVSSSGLTANNGTIVINGSLAAVRKDAVSNLFDEIDVTWFGGKATSDDRQALQAAINYAISISSDLDFGGTVIEPNYKGVAYLKIKFRSGNWNFPSATPVSYPSNANRACLTFESDSGANIVGNGSNVFLDSTGGGLYKNVFRRLTFSQFGTCLKLDTANKNESRVEFEDCQILANDVFVDTLSYATVRSTLLSFKGCFFGDTRVFIKSYTDHLTFNNCWFYAKAASVDALFYISGDGITKFEGCFFIPHGSQVSPVQDARWIDFVCDTANGTEADRAVKSLIVSNCRASLESARPFIWFFDNSVSKPSGNNQACSITVDDSYIGGTGGYPVVSYRQGYPGSVNFRNTKVLASPQICAVAAGNTSPPIPTSTSAITSHVIMIDEATRLSQSNANNIMSLVDPALEPFCYDTTTQTSKFKRSIQKNIDYRLRCVAGAAGQVKCTLPIFFDSANAAHNRDLLSFMVTCVSDIGLAPAAGRAISTCIVSLVCGQIAGVDKKKVVVESISNAVGGLAFATSCTPTAFFGTGNTGSDTINSNSSAGTEDSITISFPGTVPEVCWVYILPLAGLRENQWDKQQYDVW